MFPSRSIFISFLIAAIVFAVYAQTGSYEFLRFDDHDYTFLCPFVKDGLSWANVKAAFTTFTHAAIWMPLTYISYMLDISLFGPGMGAHHLVNAAIHAANSALFYLLLVNIFPRFHIFTFLSALFWALHPMRVEPVAWIAGRKDLLCAFFVLLGLLAVARGEMWKCGNVGMWKCGNLKTANSQQPMKKRHTHWLLDIFTFPHFHIFTFLCCLAACMSKPTGMCFPFLALCVGAMRHGRARCPQRAAEPGRTGCQPVPDANGQAGRSTSHPASPHIFTFLIAAVTGLIAVHSQTHAAGYDVRALFTAPFADRALNALKSLGLYIFKTFIPFDLHIDCRWPTPDLPADGLGTILAAVIGLFLFWMWFVVGIRLIVKMWKCGNVKTANSQQSMKKRHVHWLLDIFTLSHFHISTFPHFHISTFLFFLFAIAPTLGIFGSFGREARADRFMYIPSMAISMLLVACCCRLARRRLEDKPPYQMRESESCSGGARCFFIPLAILVSIYTICTLRLIPTFRNDYTAFSRVLACDPIHPRALSHVASEECARLRDFDSGIRHFRDSLACEWNRSTACQLAFALATRGRREDVADIRALGESTGIAKNPESDRNGLMCEALGMAALKERRWLDAVPFFSAAVRAPVRLHPRDDAFARLGVALANGGRIREAEKVFESLARPGVAREGVRAFAERSLEQLASSPDGRIMLFY